MHSVALQLAPVIAEKSKVPFYIAGGILVAWALIVSLVLGLRKPDFPGSQRGQRIVIAISAVLVLGAVSTAVLTAGGVSSATTITSGTKSPELPPEPGAPATSAASTAPASTTATTPATTSPAGATTLALAANPSGELAYDTKQLATRAGTVTIRMANMSPVEHNVTVAEGSKVLGATPTFTGGTRSLTLKLKRGTYTFYCSVPGHRQAGMEGTLTVS